MQFPLCEGGAWDLRLFAGAVLHLALFGSWHLKPRLGSCREVAKPKDGYVRLHRPAHLVAHERRPEEVQGAGIGSLERFDQIHSFLFGAGSQMVTEPQS